MSEVPKPAGPGALIRGPPSSRQANLTRTPRPSSTSSPAKPDLPVRLAERTVFGGIRRKFVDQEADRCRDLAGKDHRRPLDLNARCSFTKIGAELLANDRSKLRAAPVAPDDHLMSFRDRLQPLDYHLVQLWVGLSGAQRLADHRLDDGKRIPDAVRQLADQQSLTCLPVLLGLALLGYIDKRRNDAFDPFIESSVRPNPHQEPTAVESPHHPLDGSQIGQHAVCVVDQRVIVKPVGEVRDWPTLVARGHIED